MYRYYGISSHRNFKIMDHGLEKKVGYMHGWLILFEKHMKFYLVKFPFVEIYFLWYFIKITSKCNVEWIILWLN
jgi:hypothetical protein